MLLGGHDSNPGPDPLCCHSQSWADALAHLSSGAAPRSRLKVKLRVEHHQSKDGPPPTGRRQEGHVLGSVNLPASPRRVQMACACEAGQGGPEVPACRGPVCGQAVRGLQGVRPVGSGGNGRSFGNRWAC